MTVAPDLDPYLLPLPGPRSPVVLADRVVAMHAHLNGRYADTVWPLTPLTENPSAPRATINWLKCPAVFRDQLRLITWTMINGELRPTFLKEHGTQMRSRLGVSKQAETAGRWIRFVKWLEQRDIESLSECDTRILHEYGTHVSTTVGDRGVARMILIALTRLWAFDQLSARPCGVGRPPWEDVGVDDYLPAATSGGGENETEPLAEQTMGPLLVWAMRAVDDLADDIIAAFTEFERLNEVYRVAPGGAATKKALAAYLDPLIQARARLPASTHHGRLALARAYIGGTTGASQNQIETYAQRQHENIARLALQRPGPCPLNIAVNGAIAGVPWRDQIDFNEAGELMRHLVTACYIVIAYLTGMRTGEILGLRSGCCPDPKPAPDSRVGRHLIRSVEFKTATDENGNHHSAGVEREAPWVAITPVVNAIRVLERIVPHERLLFDRTVHELYAKRPGTGSLKHQTIRRRIEEFVTWANHEAHRLQLPGELISPDPHGNVGTARFRRSLAWHIARRPGGLVALAIQYGHMRTTLTSEGYASRGRGGIHELIDIETVRAVADTVTDLNDDLAAGTGVSGPAARRAIKAAAHAPRFAGTIITVRTAKGLIANEDVMLYDNPHALLLCQYKRAQALCHRDGVRDTPSLDHCVPGCGNIVRTDHHAAALRRRADILDQRAAHAPQPVGDRLRGNAVKLRGVADDHDRTRITLQDTTT